MNKANLTIYLQTSWDWRQFGLALWRGRAGDRGAHESGDTGKEATIGLLSDGSFFGEGSLAGQPLRMGAATAMTDCTVLRIKKGAMLETLHQEHTLSDLFVAYLLTRNIKYEEDLVDQLFNSSEKRLARVLLMLGHFGKEGKPESVIPKISQETLAEMVGTTRSRVSFFMNRFRKLGFIDYARGGRRRVTGSQFTSQRCSPRLAPYHPDWLYSEGVRTAR